MAEIRIFCPNEHLILDAPRCPECGWSRPPEQDAGALAWGPVDLGTGLGGPGTMTYTTPGARDGTLVLPLRGGELVGLDMSDGVERWRVALPTGLETRQIVTSPGGLLAAINDERPIEQAGPARLAHIDTRDGRLETIWEPGSSQLSPPVIAGSRLLVRTSASELVAIAAPGGATPAKPEILWRTRLDTFWGQAPLIAEEGESAIVLVADGQAMQGIGRIKAFSLSNGSLRWSVPTRGMLARPPVAVGDTLLYLDRAEGRPRTQNPRRLVALDMDGNERWSRTYPYTYTSLAAGRQHAYLAVRGAVAKGEPGYYLLQAIQPQDGETVWETPLEGRCRVLAVDDERTLLLACDDGVLRACDPASGGMTWELPLAEEPDRLQTHPVIASGRALAGTYAGRIAAVWVSRQQAPRLSPEQALEQGQTRLAADLHALDGDYARAAEMYAVELNRPERALALYLHAGLFNEAARLAAGQGWLGRALEIARRVGDRPLQADLLARRGDHLQAARLYEELNSMKPAAEQYEQGGELRKALSIYGALDESEQVRRLRPQVPYNASDIDELEAAGSLLEAGEAAMKAGEWRRAVDLFSRAEAPERELEALQRLGQGNGHDWVWERVAELARGLGRFALEGAAWERRDDPAAAGEAFQRAARQLELTEPRDREAIAAMFERAMRQYAEAGLIVQRRECWARVVAYRRLPQVVVEGAAGKPFREEESNTIELSIQNVGNGPAHDIEVSAGGPCFEGVYGSSSIRQARLAAGMAQQVTVYLRPLPGQVGDAVPLVIHWTWRDRRGNPYQDELSVPVRVRSKRDASTGGTPPQMHYHGPVFQTEAGQIEYIRGDMQVGDRIQGDQIASGGHKGDRVEIRRSAGEPPKSKPARMGTGPLYKGLTCPNCGLPVQEGGGYCQECGFNLPEQNNEGDVSNHAA